MERRRKTCKDMLKKGVQMRNFPGQRETAMLQEAQQRLEPNMISKGNGKKCYRRKQRKRSVKVLEPAAEAG